MSEPLYARIVSRMAARLPQLAVLAAELDAAVDADLLSSDRQHDCYERLSNLETALGLADVALDLAARAARRRLLIEIEPEDMKTIDQLERVTDLEDGACALPSPDLRYDLREISGDKIGVTVERVERRGADLFAICGERSFRVTGRGGWVLCPVVVADYDDAPYADECEGAETQHG